MSVIDNLNYWNKLQLLIVVCYEQEAQKAAEKAFNAGKVEERVKKAVAAANKAANAARVAAVKAVQNQMRLSNNNDGTPIPSIRSWKTFYHQHRAFTTKCPLASVSTSDSLRFTSLQECCKMPKWFAFIVSITLFTFAVNSPILALRMLGSCLEPHSVWNKWLIVEQVGSCIFLASIIVHRISEVWVKTGTEVPEFSVGFAAFTITNLALSCKCKYHVWAGDRIK